MDSPTCRSLVGSGISDTIRHLGSREVFGTRGLLGYITDNSEWGVCMERQLIAAHFDDRRCTNVLPGGEMTDFGMSPFFIYVAFAPASTIRTDVRDGYRAELPSQSRWGRLRSRSRSHSRR